jgi:hypothetical protein
MLKWLPTLTPIVGLIVTALSPTVQDFWVHHAAIAAVAAFVGPIVNHWLPSPIAAK